MSNNMSNNREERPMTSVVITSAGPPQPSVVTPAIPQVAPIVPTLGSTVAPTLSETQLLSQTTQQPPFTSRNGSSRRGLVHSVSIIVEPAMADGNDDSDQFDTDQRPIPSVSTERRNTIAGPYVVLEDFGFEPPRKAREEDDIVQSIIAHARLRKEEFARLLEEHAQIVKEINRAETSLL